MKELVQDLDAIREKNEAQLKEQDRISQMFARLDIMRRVLEEHKIQVNVSVGGFSGEGYVLRDDLERINALLTPMAEQLLASNKFRLENRIILEGNNAA